MKLRIRLKGGPGSGHHGHSGRPGKHGGSLPGTGGSGGDNVSIFPDSVHMDGTEGTWNPSNGGLIFHGTSDINTIDEREIYITNVYDEAREFARGKSVDLNANNAGYVRAFDAKPGKTYIVSSDDVDTFEDIDSYIPSHTELKKQGYRYLQFPHPSISTSSGEFAVVVSLYPHEDFVELARYTVKPAPTSSTNKEYKGGPGSGHHGHAGVPGQHGGSAPGTGTAASNKLPSEQRVWQGKQQKGKVPFNQNEVGRRGEVITTKAMQDMFGAEFSLMNEGLNNAPIDVAGDHRAIEVKTGVVTNGRSAQQWRITTSYTAGPTERDLIAAMTKNERSEYNRYKQTQSMLRKRQAVKEMSDIAGATIKPATVGVILSPDGTKGDVFYVPGFHLRLGWNKYANDEYYIGTYDVE